MTTILTAAQSRAARALIAMSCKQLAQVSGVDERIVREFEHKLHEADEQTRLRLRSALEEHGVVFIPENGGGAGVRLKFAGKEVRAINRWEDEGGLPAEDDVS